MAGPCTGLSINLLVRDVARSVAFAQDVLGAIVVYSDADFAVQRLGGPADWMLHADHTCGEHPLLVLTGDNALRGVGVELRLHGAGCLMWAWRNEMTGQSRPARTRYL